MTDEEFTNKISTMSLPAIATGLLNHELLLAHSKKNTGEPLEFDSLKLSDDERRKRFGARIRIMRKSLGLTQAALAEKIGTTKATVAAYEIGKRAASYKNLIGLSRVLNVTADWLIGNEPPPSVNNAAD